MKLARAQSDKIIESFLMAHDVKLLVAARIFSIFLGQHRQDRLNTVEKHSELLFIRFSALLPFNIQRGTSAVLGHKLQKQ